MRKGAAPSIAYIVAVLQTGADDSRIVSRDHTLGTYLIELGEKLCTHAIESSKTRDCEPSEHAIGKTEHDRPREPIALWADPSTAIYTP